jgi:hypothetical protein
VRTFTHESLHSRRLACHRTTYPRRRDARATFRSPKASCYWYESEIFDGFRDIHWGFSHTEDAIEFAESLLEFAALEHVMKLNALGESIGRKVYKDTMVLLRK